MQLHLQAGPQARAFAPVQRVVVGRAPTCDLVVADARVSRFHLEFVPDGPGWAFRDLGSANGVFVAGRPAPSGRIAGPVTLCLGPDADAPALQVTLAAGAPMPPPPVPVPGHAPGGHAPFAPNPIPPRQPAPAFRPAPPPAPTGRFPDEPHYTHLHQAPPAELTIGRDRHNAIVVPDLLASRFHARLDPIPTGYRITDLGSRNGTYVNGRRIDAADFTQADLLTIGRSNFRLRDGAITETVDDGNVSLSVHHLSFTLPGGKKLLDEVGFDLAPASLTAVIGPSGAGKSTLFRVLSGAQRPSAGTVTYDGRDVYANLDELRHRLGVVPQDDLVHGGLTVEQALTYAAEIRFPADVTKAERAHRLAETMAELELTDHRTTRVSRLSGGQRKRTSVAMELLTRPSLLLLDEPTSGLDPNLDKQVMLTLRRLADGGRTVLVVTHSVANLAICDNVLLLAPGGKVAYVGPPDGLLPFLGASDYADVFERIARDPDGAQARFAQARGQDGVPTRAWGGGAAPPSAPPPRQSLTRQVSTLTRRHLRVLFADRSYALFTLILPVVLGILALAVPGSGGWGPRTDPQTASEPLQLLDILIVGAAFMGTTTSVKELVAERAIYRRESGVGLSPGAYLTSKVMVFGAVSLLQAAILTTLVLSRKPAARQAVALGSPAFELFVVVALTTLTGTLLGLLISSVVSSTEQVMPLLVASVMAQLVLCGGLIPITGRPVLAQLAWVMPARWGYAAAASATDITRLVRDAPQDSLWRHSPGVFAGDLAALLLLGALACAGALARVRREARRN